MKVTSKVALHSASGFYRSMQIIQIFNQTFIMSDEAHFELNGCVNKQNICFWAEENLKETTEIRFIQKESQCGVKSMSMGLLVPISLKMGMNKQLATVNGQRYNDMINDCLIPKVYEMNVIDPYFQQDGAACQTTRLNMEILRQTFPGRLISRFGDVEWPARSSDLSPLDYFLWGYLKGKVYRNKPTNTTQLKAAIEEEIESIGQEMLTRAMNNLCHRAEI